MEKNGELQRSELRISLYLWVELFQRCVVVPLFSPLGWL